jgi:hypothetical protein
MFRIAAIAIALASGAVVLPAQAADKVPEVATPSDFGCALRMMFIGNRARNVGKDSAKDAETRDRAGKLDANARKAFSYYVGRLGPDFAATNRSDEGKQMFAAMIATPKDSLAAEIALCMTNAEKAETQLLTAMKSPTAK